MKHRFPKSLHSQAEAIFQGICSIGVPKTDARENIRSFGSKDAYRYEIHRFIKKTKAEIPSLLDTSVLSEVIKKYLERILVVYISRGRSRQSFERILCAFGKFEYAVNTYIKKHRIPSPLLEISPIRQEMFRRKKVLPKSSRQFWSRAYPDPLAIIEAIKDEAHTLQASLQFEGGCRTEGAGAPSNRKLKNPFTKDCLCGLGKDPVTSEKVGVLKVKEKGGKITIHYVSVETYKRLERYISNHGKLESNYDSYLAALNQAAMDTNQHEVGRGSHGLKFNFSIERYAQCVAHGYSHEQALQQVSLETAHFRLSETVGYLRG